MGQDQTGLTVWHVTQAMSARHPFAVRYGAALGRVAIGIRRARAKGGNQAAVDGFKVQCHMSPGFD